MDAAGLLADTPPRARGGTICPAAEAVASGAPQRLAKADGGLAAVAAFVAFAAYLLTLSRGVLGGDAGELQFVPPILGLTHPTGYPLQVLLHYAWSVVPIGSVAFRLNLLDAGFAAATVGIVVALTRTLGAGRPAALLSGFSLAFGELWWSQAVRGDKYTLNGLFLALVLLLYFRWRQRPTTARLYWLAVIYGLSLTHHRGMLLVAPALALGVILVGWRPSSPRAILMPMVLVLAPLLLYAYVPWAGERGLPPGSWPVSTPGTFVEYLLDRGYTSQIRPDEAFRGRLVEEATVLLRSFGVLGAALGVAGLVAWFRRDWRGASVLLLAFLPQAILGASYLLESHYDLPRHWVFYLPGFLIWSLWVGLGLDDVVRALGRGRQRARLIGWAAVGLLIVAQAGFVWARPAIALVRAEAGAETLDAWRQDLQHSPTADRFGRLAFSVAAPGAIIVCDWEQATVFWYLQRVEGLRPDITVRYPIESLNDVVARAGQSGQSVYIARTLPGVESFGVTSSVGPLVQVRPTPDGTLPAAMRPTDARFDGLLTLDGITLYAAAFEQGNVVPLLLSWHVGAPLSTDIAVSVRLIGPNGDVVAQQDEPASALGTSPTHAWPVGVVVGDYYELPIGSRLPPGEYHVRVVPYRPDTQAPLGRLDEARAPAEPGVEAATITVTPRRIRSPLDLLVRLAR